MCQFVRSPFCHPECNVANWSEIEGSVGVDCSRFLLHLRQPADLAAWAAIWIIKDKTIHKTLHDNGGFCALRSLFCLL